MTSSLHLPSGASTTFAVGGMGVTFRCRSEGALPFSLPSAYTPFRGQAVESELCIGVSTSSSLAPASGAVLFSAGQHWRAHEAIDGYLFELFHPPSGVVHCQANLAWDYREAEIVFSKQAWNGVAVSARAVPYPLDQLLLVPRLACLGGFLLHASGIVLNGKAWVCAGHSGDGKTTLARLLASEGVELLSDERIVVRRTEQGFMAFGTPWPGEGNVVSSMSYPLQGLFILRKATRHALGPPSTRLAAELLSRAIVPYYMPDVASRIMATLADLVVDVPVRELHFTRTRGLKALLTEASLG